MVGCNLWPSPCVFPQIAPVHACRAVHDIRRSLFWADRFAQWPREGLRILRAPSDHQGLFFFVFPMATMVAIPTVWRVLCIYIYICQYIYIYCWWAVDCIYIYIITYNILHCILRINNVDFEPQLLWVNWQVVSQLAIFRYPHMSVPENGVTPQEQLPQETWFKQKNSWLGTSGTSKRFPKSYNIFKAVD